jgi:hypothetical protein
MTILLFTNDASSTLAGAINNTATSCVLAGGTGVKFPNPAAGQGYLSTLIDAATGLIKEIVLVTAMAGDTVTTMVRAQEGTTAQNWLSGDLFVHQCTAGTMQAILQQGQAFPARVITASGAFVMNNADGGIGLSRTVAPGVSNSTLPPGPANGQVITIADLVGNFNAFPVTIAPNAGQSIAGLSGGATNAILNVNRQAAMFQWYAAANTWSFKP